MTNNTNWLLPDGVEELLPDDAAQLEKLRRLVIDELQSRQFNLVTPPVMEFLDSLLTGTGSDLDTQTYKFMDQNTRRLLGIRADMTPQIARIDAHYLSDNDVNKLCYVGTVLRTQPAQMGGARELLQAGAELFGIEDESADIEIIDAMLSVLAASNVPQLTLGIGHVGLYRELKNGLRLDNETEQRLFDILLRKSFPDLDQLEQETGQTELAVFAQLMKLQGGADVLPNALKALPKSGAIEKCIAQLATVVEHLQKAHPEVKIHLDLADVFGYRYHTGLKFSAFVDGTGRAIAKGGRYDRIGEQFGRARPATGFSTDIKSLLQFSQQG